MGLTFFICDYAPKFVDREFDLDAFRGAVCQDAIVIDTTFRPQAILIDRQADDGRRRAVLLEPNNDSLRIFNKMRQPAFLGSEPCLQTVRHAARGSSIKTS